MIPPASHASAEPEKSVSAARTQRSIDEATERINNLEERQVSAALVLQGAIAARLSLGESVELKAGSLAVSLLGERIKALPLGGGEPNTFLVYAVENPDRPGQWIEDAVYSRCLNDPALMKNLLRTVAKYGPGSVTDYALNERESLAVADVPPLGSGL